MLDSIKPKVRKTATFNGKEEIKEGIEPDWKSELSGFRQIDINKPAWSGSYLVDTALSESEGVVSRQITYNAVNPEFRVSRVIISRNSVSGKLIKLEGYINNNNLIIKSRQHLIYYPRTGYSITGSQKIIWMKEKFFEVNVEVL